MDLLPRVHVYVDGFNLYYGLLKNVVGRKWLNLALLSEKLVKRADIKRIRYFTALVSARPNDPDEPQRQQVYLRALRTLPNVEIHLGRYRSHPTRMWLAEPIPGGASTIKVIKTDEKGSDVNLATMLLCDAFDNSFDSAIIISNDSDLALPIERVKNRFEKNVFIYSPHDGVSKELQKVATRFRCLRKGPVEASQFVHIMSDDKGQFEKPKHW